MPVKEEKPDLLSMDEEALREFLNGLSAFDYVKNKKAYAKELGFSQKDLDIFRNKEQADDLQGSVIEFSDVVPWDSPVDGAAVLADASASILKYMVMRQVDADACALWALHTHIFKVFQHTARLLLTAPDAECAKTLLMVHMVGNMCNKPMAFELMKPAPFFRIAEKHKPTLLIDEADQFLNMDSEILAAVNSGWEPHGQVPRCSGDDLEVRGYSTHCPVALAGIEMHKHLKNTTISRSIVIHLERAGHDELETVTTFDEQRDKQAILDIGRKFARWCWDNKTAIKKMRAELPDGIINRVADKWRPMVALADIAGGDWPERARLALQSQPDISEPSRAVQLLIDIHNIIGDDKGIWTRDLIPKLADLDSSPWSDYNFKQYDEDRKIITNKQVAFLLKRYGVTHGTLRIGEGTAKGYTRDAINTAYERYKPKSSVTASQVNKHADSTRHKPDTDVTEPEVPDTTVTANVTGETAETMGCDGVSGNSPQEDFIPAIYGKQPEVPDSEIFVK